MFVYIFIVHDSVKMHISGWFKFVTTNPNSWNIPPLQLIYPGGWGGGHLVSTLPRCVSQKVKDMGSFSIFERVKLVRLFYPKLV